MGTGVTPAGVRPVSGFTAIVPREDPIHSQPPQSSWGPAQQTQGRAAAEDALTQAWNHGDSRWAHNPGGWPKATPVAPQHHEQQQTQPTPGPTPPAQLLAQAAQTPLPTPPPQPKAAQHQYFPNPAAQESRDSSDSQWHGGGGGNWGSWWRSEEWQQQDAAMAQIQNTTQQWREGGKGGKGKDAQGKDTTSGKGKSTKDAVS